MLDVNVSSESRGCASVWHRSCTPQGAPVMPTLRLSHQLGLAVAGLLLVVGALVAWNLVVTRQLTDAHRSLVDAAIPAVRLEIGLLEHVGALQRMEGRYAILKDPAFLTVFRDRIRTAEQRPQPAGAAPRDAGRAGAPAGGANLPRRVPSAPRRRQAPPGARPSGDRARGHPRSPLPGVRSRAPEAPDGPRDDGEADARPGPGGAGRDRPDRPRARDLRGRARGPAAESAPHGHAGRGGA